MGKTTVDIKAKDLVHGSRQAVYPTDGEVSKELVKAWWERHPMTYDWRGTSPLTEGTKDFFDDVDRRFRCANWFAQDPGDVICARLINYRQLKGKEVLEIGCGSGTVAAEFARCGAWVTAVDLTERAVALTWERFQAYQLPGAILCADAENLPFDDNTFDYVWSWGVLHHTPDMATAIQEIHRVLKPGGKAGIMVYHKKSLRYYAWILMARGVLKLKLLKHSPDELMSLYSDSGTVLARYYTVRDFLLFLSAFTSIRVQIFGLRSDLFPKLCFIRSERHWTDGLSRLFLSRLGLGHFLFVEGQK